LRVQLFDADTEGGAASDLDLTVRRGSTVVGTSGSSTSDELVQLSNPTAAGNYSACVEGFAPVNGSATFKLHIWVLGPTNPGTLKAFGPSKVYTGGTASVAASWSVPAGTRYLGVIDYRSAAAGPIIGASTVFIDASAAAASAASAEILRFKPAN
jgi:hypothetical protein